MGRVRAAEAAFHVFEQVRADIKFDEGQAQPLPLANRLGVALGRGWRAPGTGQGAKLTERGIARAVEVVKAVREAAGWETSLCTDHFGHGYLTAKEVIRLAEAFEPYNLAWVEDPMPWWDVNGHKQVTDAVDEVVKAGGTEIYVEILAIPKRATGAVDHDPLELKTPPPTSASSPARES